MNKLIRENVHIFISEKMSNLFLIFLSKKGTEDNTIDTVRYGDTCVVKHLLSSGNPVSVSLT